MEQSIELLLEWLEGEVEWPRIGSECAKIQKELDGLRAGRPNCILGVKGGEFDVVVSSDFFSTYAEVRLGEKAKLQELSADLIDQLRVITKAEYWIRWYYPD